MKFLFVFLLALALLAPLSAGAGPDRASIFSDCTFWIHGGYIVTADTLWFTKDAPNTNAALFTAQIADWFGPDLVPVGPKGDGNLDMKTRPVKKVVAYSRAPFSFMEHGAAGNSSGTVYVYVDTVGSLMTGADAVLLRAGDTFPCWTWFAYPDSIKFKEGGSDSVFFDVGY